MSWPIIIQSNFCRWNCKGPRKCNGISLTYGLSELFPRIVHSHMSVNDLWVKFKTGFVEAVVTVDPKGVAKLLDGLNIHKAPGPDGLNARVLKECSNEISPILALIFNESLARGDVPDEWRQANVSPVYKKGEKYYAANYRSVSLTCICCKIPEHILVSNINKHLVLDSILADCQHGF